MVSQEGYDGTSSLDVWVFDRANMLNGNPATFQLYVQVKLSGLPGLVM